MNVRRPTDPLLSSPIAPVGSTRAEGTSAGAASTRRAPAPAAAPSDRLDLSPEAAAAQRAPAADTNAEVERARVALRAGETLSPERLHDLRERVRTGFYDQPEAVGRIAAAAVRDLGGDATA